MVNRRAQPLNEYSSFHELMEAINIHLYETDHGLSEEAYDDFDTERDDIEMMHEDAELRVVDLAKDIGLIE